MLLKTNNKQQKREIRLSKREENEMKFDDNYFFSTGRFYYTVGMVEETRMRKLIGKKSAYYILRYNDKEVKCLEKTHDLIQATFELSWALNSDTYNKMFAEMRSAMKENGNKKTMDKKVNTNTTEKTLTELGILSGIVTGAIDTTDLDKSDIEQFINLETKRSMKRAKKDKPRVIIIPDTLPEMQTEWNY